MIITDRCEACGRNSDEAGCVITINFTKSGEQTILCERCSRWIADNVLRKEVDENGNEFYRVWRFNIGPWESTDIVAPVVKQREG